MGDKVACDKQVPRVQTSARPTTKHTGGCPQAPRLPRKTKVDVPATQNEGRCACHAKRRRMRLPRETKVEVAKCHACHAKRRWMSQSPTLATRNEDVWRQVPRLPRNTQVDAPKCHACQTKRKWMSPSTTPAKQHTVPKCHPCHAKQRWMSPSPVHDCHAKRRWMSPSATPATRNKCGCHQVPRKCHAGRAKRRR